jgi:hypothetical protein
MNVFDYHSDKYRFLLQLPYLHPNGAPRAINLTQVDANMLVQTGSHRAIHCHNPTQDHLGTILITPRIAAATNVIFQNGEPAL